MNILNKNFIKLCFILLLLVCINPAIAIYWESVTTPLNKTAYLDTDSITEYSRYYFYNIKVFNEYINDFSVITIQSAKTNPFSARIKTYSVGEYEKLKGDYNNITANITQNLEPVTYESQVNSCYKRVKEIKSKEKIDISF